MNVVQGLTVTAAAVAGLGAGLALGPRAGRLRKRPQPGGNAPSVATLLHLVTQTSSTGIAVVDRYRDTVLLNPRAEELGLVRDRVLDERAWAIAQRVLDGDETAECDITDEKPQPGRGRIAVRCVARPLAPQAEGFAVLFADDDSEQVRMEATRRDFVANVSHELKTPVGAMSLLAEALLESADDPASVQHFGERVRAEAIRLGNMVSELIALSRLQGAEKLPDLDVVDVDAVVTEAVDRSRTAAEVAGISVSTDSPSGLEVLGDQTLLVTALSNLVENAIAYSPRGSHVSVSRTLRGDKVAVAVTDRGIGIAKEDQERVFERFFRVDKARSRATGGTGLGLAIVKHVAANHNGDITLWSKVGTGSTFTLRIPVYVEPDHAGNGADPRTRVEAGR
ncbi:MAG: sensor histidine kinase [Mycobacteriaceae bacterium]|nr:sensor histidine kinase [Mycobacteriaceae bacterium]